MHLFTLLATFTTVLSLGISSQVAETSVPDQTTSTGPQGDDVTTTDSSSMNDKPLIDQIHDYPTGIVGGFLGTEDMETEDETDAGEHEDDIAKEDGFRDSDVPSPRLPGGQDNKDTGRRPPVRPSKVPLVNNDKRRQVINSVSRPSPTLLAIPLTVVMTYGYYA